MKFGKRHEYSRILLDQFRLEIIIIEAAQRSQFPLFAPLIVGVLFAVLLIIAQIFHILFDIFPGELL